MSRTSWRSRPSTTRSGSSRADHADLYEQRGKPGPPPQGIIQFGEVGNRCRPTRRAPPSAAKEIMKSAQTDVPASWNDSSARRARTRAPWQRCCGRGELEAVWMPDERCRILRRRLARRVQLVRARSRSKNEIHASLQRRLQAKPPCSGLFGVKGRRWLAALELASEERESVDAGMRDVEVSRRGDRGGGEADREAGAVVAGDPAADDRPRCEPHLRSVVHRRDRTNATPDPAR